MSEVAVNLTNLTPNERRQLIQLLQRLDDEQEDVIRVQNDLDNVLRNPTHRALQRAEREGLVDRVDDNTFEMSDTRIYQQQHRMTHPNEIVAESIEHLRQVGQEHVETETFHNPILGNYSTNLMFDNPIEYDNFGSIDVRVNDQIKRLRELFPGESLEISISSNFFKEWYRYNYGNVMINQDTPQDVSVPFADSLRVWCDRLTNEGSDGYYAVQTDLEVSKLQFVVRVIGGNGSPKPTSRNSVNHPFMGIHHMDSVPIGKDGKKVIYSKDKRYIWYSPDTEKGCLCKAIEHGITNLNRTPKNVINPDQYSTLSDVKTLESIYDIVIKVYSPTVKGFECIYEGREAGFMDRVILVLHNEHYYFICDEKYMSYQRCPYCYHIFKNLSKHKCRRAYRNSKPEVFTGRYRKVFVSTEDELHTEGARRRTTKKDAFNDILIFKTRKLKDLWDYNYPYAQRVVLEDFKCEEVKNFVAVEKKYKELTQLDVLKHQTLPKIAFQTLENMGCLKNTKSITDRDTEAFLRKFLKTWGVKVNKHYYSDDEFLRKLDFCSFYPSIMKSNEFPTGTAKYDIDGLIAGCRVHWLCMTDDNEMLNSIEHKLPKNIKQCVYWTESEKSLKPYMDKFLPIKLIEKSPESKLLINSVYGYLAKRQTLERRKIIHSKAQYAELLKLKAIGTDIKSTVLNPETEICYYIPKDPKPISSYIHLAVFVLAHAKNIMATIISKLSPTDWFYSNTDSILMKNTACHKISEYIGDPNTAKIEGKLYDEVDFKITRYRCEVSHRYYVANSDLSQIDIKGKKWKHHPLE